MGASIIPLLLFTALWAVVGIVLPIFVPRGANRGYVFYYMLYYYKNSRCLKIVFVKNKSEVLDCLIIT